MFTPNHNILHRTAILVTILLTHAGVFGQTWTLIAPMKESRATFGLVPLRGNTILVAGGRGNGMVRTSSEIYDIATNTWSTAGPLNVGKQNYPLVLLLDGRAYAPSGLISTGTDMTEACEIFDPKTLTWELTTPLQESREGSAAILLPNGKVLCVAGDFAPPGLYRKTCEIFDPVTKAVSFTGSVSQGQFGNVLFMHPDGDKVIMISDHYDGAQGTWLDKTEEYDIAKGEWEVVAHSTVPHGSWIEQAVQLPTGEIVAPSGGSAIDVATPLIEIYNPTTKAWRTIGNMITPRVLATTVYLGGDSIIVIGGYSFITKKALADCEIINVKTGSVRKGPTLNERRYFHRVHVVRHTDIESPCCEELRIFVFGGENEQGTDLTSCELITMKGVGSSPITFPPSVAFSGTLCTGIDTSITIRNTGCSSILIDSIVATNVALKASALPMILKRDSSASISVSLQSVTGGTFNGVAKVYYRSSCAKLDTSIVFSATFTGAAKGTIRPIISDVPDGKTTVEMPLYLINNSGDQFSAFEITLGFRKDLLDVLPPRFDGTLADGATLVDVTTTATGATIYVPQQIALSSAKPLCILRFASHLSDTSCTTVKLDGVQLEDASANTCIYAVLKDSALICKTLNVQPDATPCQLTISKLSYDPGTHAINVLLGGCSDLVSTEMYDMLGKQIWGSTLPSGQDERIPFSDLPAGVYTVIARNTGGAAVRQLIVTR